MPSPELAQSLADLGGFALFLFTVTVAAVGLWKQWWVPGWLWRSERDARITAETQALRNAEALQRISKAMTSERGQRRVRSTSGDR